MLHVIGTLVNKFDNYYILKIVTDESENAIDYLPISKTVELNPDSRVLVELEIGSKRPKIFHVFNIQEIKNDIDDMNTFNDFCRIENNVIYNSKGISIPWFSRDDSLKMIKDGKYLVAGCLSCVLVTESKTGYYPCIRVTGVSVV